VKALCSELQESNQSESVRTAAAITAAIADLAEHNKELVRKYRKEMALRKKYHNELVELKGTLFSRI